MSTTLDIFSDSLGALIDLTPEVKLMERKKYKLTLKYDLYGDDVNAAWADAAHLISESYVKTAVDEEFEKQFDLYKCYFKSYKKNLDLADNISLEDISKYVVGHKCEVNRQKKIKSRFQLSYE